MQCTIQPDTGGKTVTFNQDLLLFIQADIFAVQRMSDTRFAVRPFGTDC